MESLFPDLKNVKKKSELWKMFPKMISCLKLRTHGVNQAQIIKEKCSEFFCKFKENYISKFITPYIHILGHIEKINLVLEEADLILNRFSMKMLKN